MSSRVTDQSRSKVLLIGLDPSATHTSSDLVGPNPHFSEANNRINPQSGELYQYDGVGNLTQGRDGEDYVFNAENKMKSFNGGASQGGADYSYDCDGRRVKKVVGTVTTVFVYDVSGRLIAEYSNALPSTNGTRYLTGDHLGSPRVVTDSSGVVKARHDYHPFGEETGLKGGRTVSNGYVADNISQKFTAKERDNETGLDYFMARYYSSLQGRFTSPDDFLNDTHLSDPASWNLYTYARNNPLNILDPTGEEVSGDDLTEKERQKLINDWRRKTGYVDIHFDANNKLVINRDAGIAIGPDGKRLGSADARANLTDLVESKTVFNLESANGSKEVAFASVDAGTVTTDQAGSRSLS
jgi:RHS repeat-associated protein